VGTLTGRIGEEQAGRFLQRRGYRILDRNARLGRGELDIVAQCGELLVFVEVKTHKDRDSALLAVDPDKCSRLVSAAEMWRSLHHNLTGLQCRFDLIIITPRLGWTAWLGPHIEHMEDIIR